MRSHYCGQLNTDLVDQTVTLCGWVNKRRDLGGLIFIDMRDRTGLVQVVFDPDQQELFATANKLRQEFCIRLVGTVRARPDHQVNATMATGAVEVMASELEIISRAEPLPIDFNQQVSEEQRLRYRYLDLRRPQMSHNLQFRAKVTSNVRRFLDQQGFLDIETPMLTRATPEGARDYLVPSRTHKGKFFALPQSPQLFKQLLMMSGFDRYYQIVKCFRDEDLRADRQPEFTQLDIETSFMGEEEIMTLIEGMIRQLFSQVLSQELPDPFPRMSYAEAIARYGVDKPDLRIPLELVEVKDLMTEVSFKVFSGPANDPRGRVTALRVPQGSELSRKQIDEYTQFVGRYGAKGLAYIKVNDPAQGRDGLQSPIIKNLSDEALQGVLERTGAEAGDLIFFGADKAKVVSEALGALRVKLGHDLNLLTCEWAPLWVVDFPMFEENDDGSLSALHHPFTAPKCTPQELQANPGTALSRAYDMVLNGTELGGGSIRIHRKEIQQTVFDILGISADEQQEKFGFLLDALKYGAPPHGGLAFGLDQIGRAEERRVRERAQ